MKRKNRQGFSLVEMLFAMFMLSVGAASTAGFVAYLMQATQTTNHITAATAAARERLDLLQEQGYDEVTDGSETVGPVDLAWSVSQEGADLKRVTVTANWTNIQGHTGTVDMGLFLADRFTLYVPPITLPPPGSGSSGAETGEPAAPDTNG